MSKPNVSEPVEVTPAEVQVTSVSVKLTRRVDLGFAPYIAYLRKLGKNGNPKFGTRDMSQAEVDLFLNATIPAGMLPEDAMYDLLKRANALADQILEEEFPRAFNAATENNIAEDMFVVKSTSVERTAQEY
jgi:hypothetical protein